MHETLGWTLTCECASKLARVESGVRYFGDFVDLLLKFVCQFAHIYIADSLTVKKHTFLILWGMTTCESDNLTFWNLVNQKRAPKRVDSLMANSALPGRSYDVNLILSEV